MLHAVNVSVAEVFPLPLEHAWVLRNYTRTASSYPLVLLADDPASPSCIAAFRGGSLLCHAKDELSYALLFKQLLNLEVPADCGWPDKELATLWEQHGFRWIFLNTAPLAAYQAALDAGFASADEDDLHWAYPYVWQGAPRFSAGIRHSVRLGHASELHERLMLGIGYDPEGNYIRSVLASNPSYVCEVAGEPVSWSTIHLNGSMGMIYTPPENRRQGYARSLAAFQIDDQLRRHGLALAHVVHGNTASEAMLESFAALKGDIPVVWRAIRWP